MSRLNMGEGHVFHSRREITENSFRYPSFFLFFATDAEDELSRVLKSTFKNSLSVDPRDYLRGDAVSLDQGIRNFLKEVCCFDPERIWLQTMPRMLNYVFNPVSFWICKRADLIEAVLVEVNNTFGERHFYWIQPSGGVLATQWIRAEKVFHVSPFFPVDGYYMFRFQVGSDRNRIDINYHNSDGTLRLATWIEGDLAPLQKISPAKIFVRYGWMTPMVVLRIHLQALRLFLKKVRFFKKPSPPHKEIST
ncbi:DUF1365 domain-containing protein [Bdellovibrio sp. HCB209]|uniref:DUF1365 domain-containing protein n=1 Tax=Bdellovibrio sp. HCB209 TaxID=3394354 RepID=UPI0039B56FE7